MPRDIGSRRFLVFCVCLGASMMAAEPAMAAKCQISGIWYDYSDPVCKMQGQALRDELERRRIGQSSPPRSSANSPRQTVAATNPVCALPRNNVRDDLKEHLIGKYDNYSAVEMLLNAGMKSYDELCAMRVDAVDVQILEKLLARYYPSMGVVQTLHKSQRESYERLK